MPEKIRWLFNGIDRRALSVGSPETCRNGKNFLFTDGRAFNRPGLATSTLTGLAAGYWVGKALRLDRNTSTEEYLVANNLFGTTKVYFVNFLAASEITPDVGGFANVDLCGFLGSMYIASGSVSGGIYRHAGGGGGISTRVHTEPYSMLTSHLSRLVAAHSSSRKVGWSVPGNGDDWTNPGSGTVTLADTEDRFVGLYNIRNQIVLLRKTGITMFYPTGTSSPAFRSESVIDGMDPVLCGECSYGDGVFWVGNSNVYRFDGTRIEPIGDAIMGDILLYARSANTWKGFVTNGSGETGASSLKVPRAMYHLVPISSNSHSAAGVPHFTYDLTERLWSKHIYGTKQFSTGYEITDNGGSSTSDSTPGFFDFTTPANRYQWTEIPCEEASTLNGHILLVGEEEADQEITRALLTYRDVDEVDITIAVEAMLNKVRTATVVPVHIGTGLDETWVVRQWADLRKSGQFFRLSIDVPAGFRADFQFLTMYFDKAGEYRGQ